MSLPDLIAPITRALLGSHPKSTFAGLAIGVILLLSQAWIAYKGQPVSEVMIATAIAMILGGRAYRRTSQAKRDVPNGPSGGDITLGMAVVLAVMAIGGICVLTGCTTDNTRTAQKGVNTAVEKFAGKRGLDLIDTFRRAEGAIYAEDNGLISTQGMERIIRLYAVDERRWIKGRVIPRVYRVEDLPAIGEDPATGTPATAGADGDVTEIGGVPGFKPSTPASGPVNGSIVQ